MHGGLRGELIVIGGGEFARMVIETARRDEWEVLGFVDPLPCEETAQRCRVVRLGDDGAIGDYPDAKLILGLGCVTVSPLRKQLVSRIGPGRWGTVKDPYFTYISQTAEIGEGTVILPGAAIGSGARIGPHCILNLGVKIDHDVQVGGFVHVAPQAALGGGSRIGDGAFIGMGAMVRDHTLVSERTLVGMGAVVTEHYAAGLTLLGIPAKPATR